MCDVILSRLVNDAYSLQKVLWGKAKYLFILPPISLFFHNHDHLGTP